MLSGSRTKESSPFDCDYPLHFVLFCSFWFFSIVDLIRLTFIIFFVALFSLFLTAELMLIY